MNTNFAKQWKTIKTDYETATNRKKPSDTILGVIKTKSGLGEGFTAMDAAMKKDDLKEAQKAHEKLEKSAIAYRKVLIKVAVAEKNKDFQKETNKMMDELEELIDASQMSIRAALKIPNVFSMRDFAALKKTPAFDRVEEYAKRTHSPEVLNFLIAMQKKDYSLKTFNTFIRTNEINLPDTLLKEFDETDLKKAPWAKATDIAFALFTQNTIVPLNREKP